MKKTFTDKIKQAKEVKILDLVTGDVKKIGEATYRTNCPFHGDTTIPNLTIYDNNNTFWCFACNTGRDVIDFYQKLHNVDFKEAVKELCKIR